MLKGAHRPLTYSGEELIRLLVHRAALAACNDAVERRFRNADRRKGRGRPVDDVEMLIDQMENSE